MNYIGTLTAQMQAGMVCVCVCKYVCVFFYTVYGLYTVCCVLTQSMCEA